MQILALPPDETSLLPGQPVFARVQWEEHSPPPGEMMCAQHPAPQSSSLHFTSQSTPLHTPFPGCVGPRAKPRLGTAEPLLREQLVFAGSPSAGLTSPPCLHPNPGNPAAYLLGAPAGLRATLPITPVPGPRKPPGPGWSTQHHVCSRHRWHQRACQMPALRVVLTYCCSVAQSCPTLCDAMDCSTPVFPVHHQLLELAQTHIHHVGDVIQPPHPLSPPSPAFSLSQHQGLFQ